jgi:hypothetical protein
MLNKADEPLVKITNSPEVNNVLASIVKTVHFVSSPSGLPLKPSIVGSEGSIQRAGRALDNVMPVANGLWETTSALSETLHWKPEPTTSLRAIEQKDELPFIVVMPPSIPDVEAEATSSAAPIGSDIVSDGVRTTSASLTPDVEAESALNGVPMESETASDGAMTDTDAGVLAPIFSGVGLEASDVGANASDRATMISGLTPREGNPESPMTSPRLALATPGEEDSEDVQKQQMVRLHVRSILQQALANANKDKAIAAAAALEEELFHTYGCCCQGYRRHARLLKAKLAAAENAELRSRVVSGEYRAEELSQMKFFEETLRAHVRSVFCQALGKTLGDTNNEQAHTVTTAVEEELFRVYTTANSPGYRRHARKMKATLAAPGNADLRSWILDGGLRAEEFVHMDVNDLALRLQVRSFLRRALGSDDKEQVMKASSAMEGELFRSYGGAKSPRYRRRARMLKANLSAAGNAELRSRIVSGGLRAEDLVHMDSTELATGDLRAQREETLRTSMIAAVHQLDHPELQLDRAGLIAMGGGWNKDELEAMLP